MSSPSSTRRPGAKPEKDILTRVVRPGRTTPVYSMLNNETRPSEVTSSPVPVSTTDSIWTAFWSGSRTTPYHAALTSHESDTMFSSPSFLRYTTPCHVLWVSHVVDRDNHSVALYTPPGPPPKGAIGLYPSRTRDASTKVTGKGMAPPPCARAGPSCGSNPDEEARTPKRRGTPGARIWAGMSIQDPPTTDQVIPESIDHTLWTRGTGPQRSTSSPSMTEPEESVVFPFSRNPSGISATT